MEQNPKITKDELLKLAKRRVIMKKAMQWHAIVFLLINALLCAIYYLATPNGYFWPIWSIVGWGAGVVIHAIVPGVALSSTRNKQSSVEKEYQMLLKDFNQNDDNAN